MNQIKVNHHQEPKSPANPRTGSESPGGAGPESLCEPWKQAIEAALAAGLSVQRIHQDLVAEHEFAGSYDSVWRFVRRLERVVELPFRRIEVECYGFNCHHSLCRIVVARIGGFVPVPSQKMRRKMENCRIKAA